MPAPEAASGSAGATLGGLRVLVTRPAERSDALCAELARRGATPLRVPAIEIAAPRDPGAARDALARLHRFHLAVFVSPSAVDHAFALAPPGWPRELPVAALGPGTRAALRRHGVEPEVVPAGRFDAEALLCRPELAAGAVAGRRLALFKGEGGREGLAGELRRRGARVTEIVTYRRRSPEGLGARLRRCRVPDLVLLTSVEAAGNLARAAGAPARARLSGAHFVAISDRVSVAVRGSGLGRSVSVAPRASDAGLVQAAEAWAASRS